MTSSIIQQKGLASRSSVVLHKKQQYFGNLPFNNTGDDPLIIEVIAQGKIELYRSRLNEDKKNNVAIFKNINSILLSESRQQNVPPSPRIQINVMPKTHKTVHIFFHIAESMKNRAISYAQNNRQDISRILKTKWWGKLLILMGFFKLFNRIEVGKFTGIIIVYCKQQAIQTIPLNLKLLL